MNFWYTIGKSFFSNYTWRRPSRDKVVYLTFDDGPHPEITPWVMDQLESVGARGTFFAVGENAERYPGVIEGLISRGHQVGNHTHRHVKGWKTSAENYNEEVSECYKHIPNTGLFRPPYGQINFKAVPQISSKNEIIMWDVLTKDYLPRLNTRLAQRRIRRLTTRGSIIVFHDSEKAKKNLIVLLPKYLDFLVQNGYKMEIL